ncbi:MAG TPA: efflux RND transporter periplasmic adaptor subunit [Nitrospiria bacterium]|nr:efflux RND transporter periplasmic adaptor subunit [Nitrospiria bacterium]
MNRRTWIGTIGLGVVLVGAILYAFLPGPVPVEVSGVSSGPLQVTVEEDGKTRVIDRFVVSAPVAGYAQRVELDVGDPVTRGQPLVVVEPLRSQVLDPRSRAEAESRVSAAMASLNAAQENERAAATEAEHAAADLERLKPLFESGYASKELFDKAESEARRTAATHRSAQFAVEVARHELEAARTALRYSGAGRSETLPEQVMIRAPVDGRVLKIQHKSEGVVAAGESLIEVGNPRSLEVETDVLSADAVRIKPGARVLFDRWGGGAPLEGRVRMIEPVGFTKISALGVEEQRVWVISDFVSAPEQWERLGDGYRVEARFIIWESDHVLQVPTSALFRHGDGWVVFVLDGHRARRRPVDVGHRSGLSTEILGGLKAGERVITHPSDAIDDGVRVRVR